MFRSYLRHSFPVLPQILVSACPCLMLISLLPQSLSFHLLMPYPIYPSQPPAPTLGLLMQKLMKRSLVQFLLPDSSYYCEHSISSLLTFGCGGGLQSDRALFWKPFWLLRAFFKAIFVFSLLTGFSKSQHISKGLTLNHCLCMLNRLLTQCVSSRSLRECFSPAVCVAWW